MKQDWHVVIDSRQHEPYTLNQLASYIEEVPESVHPNVILASSATTLFLWASKGFISNSNIDGFACRSCAKIIK